MCFDSLVYTPAALRHLVQAVGADRVVLGSDYPFDMGVDDPVDRLRAAGLDPVTEQSIRGGTASHLFGLTELTVTAGTAGATPPDPETSKMRRSA